MKTSIEAIKSYLECKTCKEQVDDKRVITFPEDFYPKTIEVIFATRICEECYARIVKGEKKRNKKVSTPNKLKEKPNV